MLQATYTHFCRPRGVKLVSADVCARRKALVGGDRAFYDLYCADCAGPEPLPAPEVVSVAESTTPPKAAPSGRLNTSRPVAKAPSRPVCNHAPGRDAARTPGGAAFSQQMEAPMSQEHAPEHGPMCRRPGCDQPQKITAKGKPMGYCEAHWREAVAKGKGQGLGGKRRAKGLVGVEPAAAPAPAPQPGPIADADGAGVLGCIARQQLALWRHGQLTPAGREVVMNTLVLCLEGLANRGYLPGWNEAAA